MSSAEPASKDTGHSQQRLAPQSKADAQKSSASAPSGLTAALAELSVSGNGTPAIETPLQSTPVAEAKLDNGETVITPDPADHSIRHPLQNEWTMWYNNPANKGKGKGWQSNSIKKILDFQTVEDFWSLFNNLQPASSLDLRCDYHLFKKGVRPEWEDKQNEGGGEWRIEFERRGNDVLNRCWTYTVLSLIGEQFEDIDAICGASVSIRKAKNRVVLWTKDADDETLQRRIGSSFKKHLETDRKITFTKHKTEGDRISL